MKINNENILTGRDKLMVEYLYCSMAGSYYVECELLNRLGYDKYEIKFINLFNEEEIKVVTPDYLRFSNRNVTND